MATTRKKRRSKKKTAAPKRRRRRSKVRAVAAPRRRRHKKKAAKVTRRRRRRTVKVEARRRRRRAPAAAPKRRRRRRVSEAWKGDKAGHATAARKGHRRRKARGNAPRRRRRRKAAESVVAAPRRHRRRKARASQGMMAKRSRRRHHVRASRGGGMNAAEMVLMTAAGGLGFVMADGLDRFLATYDPSGVKPTDKFTSDGSGTLANTLNIAAMPNWKRLAAGVGVTAVPAVGAMFVKNSYGRATLEGMAIGSGISAFKTFWNNILMPLLVGKDTTAPALQKSYIARLYPAEVAAHVNKTATKTAGGPAAGVLSGAPQADVGPFALAGDSPYPDAHTALGYGVSGDSPYPNASEALRHAAGVSGDSPYPDAGAALRHQAGMGASDWNPGPPAGVGPGPQPGPQTDCGCVGDPNPYLGFVGDAPSEETPYPGLSN